MKYPPHLKIKVMDISLYIFEALKVNEGLTLISNGDKYYKFNVEESNDALFFWDEKNDVTIHITPFYDNQDNIYAQVEIINEDKQDEVITIEYPMSIPTTTDEADKIIKNYFSIAQSIIASIEMIYLKK